MGGKKGNKAANEYGKVLANFQIVCENLNNLITQKYIKVIHISFDEVLSKNLRENKNTLKLLFFNPLSSPKPTQ